MTDNLDLPTASDIARANDRLGRAMLAHLEATDVTHTMAWLAGMLVTLHARCGYGVVAKRKGATLSVVLDDDPLGERSVHHSDEETS